MAVSGLKNLDSFLANAGHNVGDDDFTTIDVTDDLPSDSDLYHSSGQSITGDYSDLDDLIRQVKHYVDSDNCSAIDIVQDDDAIDVVNVSDDEREGNDVTWTPVIIDSRGYLQLAVTECSDTDGELGSSCDENDIENGDVLSLLLPDKQHVEEAISTSSSSGELFFVLNIFLGEFALLG